MRKKFLSIGEFAKLKGVSVKSLRYYERIGVLRPAFVNAENGYRYYTPEQITRLDLILLCLSLGLPLRKLQSSGEGKAPELRALIADGRRMALEKLGEAKKALRLSDDVLAQTQRLEMLRAEDRPCRCKFGERSLLLSPWDIERDGGRAYVYKIKRLYELAREDGLTVLMQQGLLISHADGRHFVFIEAEGEVSAHGLFKLPAGSYYCRIMNERELKLVPHILSAEGTDARFSICLNTDIYDYCSENGQRSFEVQSFVGKA